MLLNFKLNNSVSGINGETKFDYIKSMSIAPCFTMITQYFGSFFMCLKNHFRDQKSADPYNIDEISDLAMVIIRGA